MNDSIENTAKQIKEIMEACRTIIDGLQKDDPPEVLFCQKVIALTHNYLFKLAPQEAALRPVKKKV